MSDESNILRFGERTSAQLPEGDDSAGTKEKTKTVISRIKGLLGSQAEDSDQVALALQNGDAAQNAPSHSRREMIERVIEFDSKRVADVMIPRADIVSVEQEMTLTELLKTFSDAGHSRLPVYRGDLDDPVGMVHIRDLVGILADPQEDETLGAEPILARLVRKVLYVPASMSITDLLLRMQARRIHMALVIDEFGGTDGLVTIEDLVEEIVGDIQDEHDDEDDTNYLKQISPQNWEANARLPLDELEEVTRLELNVDDDDIDTLGGLVFTLAGRVPLRGEVLIHPLGIEFEVLDADPRRIRKIKFRLLHESDEPLGDG